MRSAIGANSASEITPESHVTIMSHQYFSALIHCFECYPEENESSDGLRLRTKSWRSGRDYSSDFVASTG